MEKSRNWAYCFDMVYKKFSDYLKNSGADEREISQLAMARFLGISQGKMIAWGKGQWPSAEDLATIAAKLGFSYRWLVTGEGDPFANDAPTPKATVPKAAPDPERDARITTLEAELRAREKELLEARSEIIVLQRKLLERHPAEKEGCI